MPLALALGFCALWMFMPALASAKTISVKPGKAFSVTAPSPGSWCRLSAPGGRLTVRSKGARSIRFRFTVSRRARRGAYVVRVSCARRPDMKALVRVKSGRGTARSLVAGRVSARRIGQRPSPVPPRPVNTSPRPAKAWPTLAQFQAQQWTLFVAYRDRSFERPYEKGVCSEYVWIKARDMYKRLFYAAIAAHYTSGPAEPDETEPGWGWREFANDLSRTVGVDPKLKLAFWHRYGFEVGNFPRAGAIDVDSNHMQMVDRVIYPPASDPTILTRYVWSSYNHITTTFTSAGPVTTGGRGIVSTGEFTIDDQSGPDGSDPLYFIYP